MMPLYQAYGLQIASALPLPGLRPGTGRADASVRVEATSPWAPRERGRIRFISVSTLRTLLSWGGVGELLITGGERIVAFPEKGGDHGALALFILGAGLGVLLHQRGLLVLHGSAVRVCDRTLGFIGAKGQGKSTLAAALYRRGHTLVSDELLVMRFAAGGRAFVLPGALHIRLWHDAMVHLEQDVAESARVRLGVEKYYQDTERLFPGESMVHGLYILDQGHQHQIEPMQLNDALLAIIPHLYVCRFGTDFLRATNAELPFLQMSQLVKQTRVKRLIRRPGLDRLTETACMVEADH